MKIRKIAQEINLKAIRELRNYSQSYVADMMGITQSYYSRLENGSSKIDFELLSKALEVLDVKEIDPIFNKEYDILESLEKRQRDLFELQRRISALENKVEKLENEVKKIKIKNM